MEMETIWRKEISHTVKSLSENFHLGQQKLVNMMGEVNRDRGDRENKAQAEAVAALNSEVDRLRSITGSSSDDTGEVAALRSELQDVSQKMQRIEGLLHELLNKSIPMDV